MMPSREVKKFTPTLLDGATAESKRYTISCNSLQLRVTTTGKKTWAFAYRFDGKSGRLLTIGSYPAFSLADANEAVKEAREALAKGVDPVVYAKLVKAVAIDSAKLTVTKLAQLFLTNHKVGDLTKRDYKALLDAYILPTWKDVPVEDINRTDARILLKQLTDRGITRRANMTKSLIQTMWRYGISEDLIESYPFEGLKDPALKSSRKRFLSESEMSIFWHGLLKINSFRTRLVLRLIMLLGRRETELVGAQWKEFDLDKGQWFIPVKRIVNGKTVSSGLKVHESMKHKIDGLMVPLPTLVVKMLKEWKERSELGWEQVFPSETNPKMHHSAHALSQALCRNWSDMGLSEAVAPHDLRRTAITHMSRLGIEQHIIDRITGHSVGNDVQQTYNRYGYLEEKHKALETWSTEVQRLISMPRN
jgi:integrase